MDLKLETIRMIIKKLTNNQHVTVIKYETPHNNVNQNVNTKTEQFIQMK